MTWLILTLMEKTGLGKLVVSLIIYGAIIGAIVLGYWWWSDHLYNSGYTAGSAHEALLWQKQRDKDLAQQSADKKATQAEIDRLEAELQLDAQARKDAQADADLKAAQEASPTKTRTCLPREISRALNREGR